VKRWRSELVVALLVSLAAAGYLASVRWAAWSDVQRRLVGVREGLARLAPIVARVETYGRARAALEARLEVTRSVEQRRRQGWGARARELTLLTLSLTKWPGVERLRIEPEGLELSLSHGSTESIDAAARELVERGLIESFAIAGTGPEARTLEATLKRPSPGGAGLR
jgi:hypothetical protein